MHRPTRVAWIIPAHNRREITLDCLRRLHMDGVFTWSRAYVVDDGSSDGTGAAVALEFPEARVLHGAGNLWWTGATEFGMRTAFSDGADFIGWLNDDTQPLPGACAQLLATVEQRSAVVSGQCYVHGTSLLVYGGLRRARVSLHLEEATGTELRPADAAAGNFVLFPRAIIRQIGFPDGSRLPHAFGDTDYTLRARAAGFAVLVDPRVRAACTPNALANYTSWLLSDVQIADIWTPLWRKRSYTYAPAYARFLIRHFGLIGACYFVWIVGKRVPISLARLVTTLRWRRRVWGHRSLAWQEEQRLRAVLGEEAFKSTARAEALAHETRGR